MPHGQFGIERPPGMMPLSETPTIPTASSIERTMFWLDQIAIQHDWVNRYSSEDIIWQSGFRWKRHNGEELEEFIPKDSGEYNLIGYPINSQGQFENFREIMKFTGDKTLRYYDMYGGNQATLTNSLFGYNSSGIMWQGNKWITYGAYTNYKLNHSGEASFVDYRDSSHTKYMGRHGKISAPDYKQYIAPTIGLNNNFLSFHGTRGGTCNIEAYLHDYNTISPTDFKCTEDDYGIILMPEAINQVVTCSGWTYTIAPSFSIGPVGSQWGVSSRHNIFPYVILSGYPNLQLWLSDFEFTSDLLPGGVGIFQQTLPSFVGTEYIETPAFVRTPTKPGFVRYLDYLGWTLDADGYVTSTTLLDRFNRVIDKYTREYFNVTVDWSEAFCGVIIPLSRKVIEPENPTSSGDTPHYLRSFTGLTPNDSLDLVSQRTVYGSTNTTLDTYNHYFYDSHSVTLDGSGTGFQETGILFPYIDGYQNNIHTATSSLIMQNISTFTPNNNLVKLIYGFIDYSGYYNTNEPLNLIRKDIDSENYTIIGDISNNTITFNDIDFGIRNFSIPSPSSPSGINTLKNCGVNFISTDFPSGTQQVSLHNFLKNIGSISSLVDIEPPGNIMYICLIHPDSAMSGVQNMTYPDMGIISQQVLFEHTLDSLIYYQYALYDNPFQYVCRTNVGQPTVTDSETLTFPSYSRSNYGFQEIPGTFTLDFGANISKFGRKSYYNYSIFNAANSSIIGEHSSYGAIDDGDLKIARNFGFAMLYANTNTYSAP